MWIRDSSQYEMIAATLSKSRCLKRPLARQAQRSYTKLSPQKAYNNPYVAVASLGVVPVCLQQHYQASQFMPPAPMPLALSAIVSPPTASTSQMLIARVKDLVTKLWRKIQALWRLGEILLVSSPCMATYPIAKGLRTSYPALYEAWWKR